ncbi:MAG: 2-oxo acid dehydrogenase subunit E2 [Anaerolineaceae bacterium]|nr:2-oxo acid dehydrogenase subunit E2 [Anaerolineaceae bacterium]MDE0327615.1 2-oxo acid dehydrogenase subunit E2 [Anaerolineaceae bacterium]
MYRVVMPALEMAQETGTLLRWLKQEGEPVQRGEPLMEIETDKVTLEIEAGGSGVLAQVSAAPGDVVPVGQVIALLLAEGEAAESVAPASSAALTPNPFPSRGAGAPSRLRREPFSGRGALSASAGRSEDASTQPRSGRRGADSQLAASPLARRLAAEHGVDLRHVRAASGRITKADVEAWLERRPEEATPVPMPLSGSGARPTPGGSPSGKGALGRAEGRDGNVAIPASPLARRMAAERGLELATLEGSGPEGTVLVADVMAAAREAEAASAAETIVAAAEPTVAHDLRRVVPLTGMRGAIAARTQASAQAAPHISLTLGADMRAALLLQQQLSSAVESASGHKLTLTAVLARVVAETLGSHPRLNAQLLDDGIHELRAVNLGVAVALDDGLLVPVIRDCDGLGLAELQARLQELAQRARARQLASSGMSGGTFTLSNLGMYGIEHFTAIINPPEVAILSVGAVQECVVADAGQVAVRPMLQLTINVDHRAVDGAVAAAFLRDVKRLLEDPWSLLV